MKKPSPRNLLLLASAVALIVGYRLRRGGSPSGLLPGPSSSDTRPKAKDLLGKGAGLSSLGALAPGAHTAESEAKCSARWLEAANMRLEDFQQESFFKKFLATDACANFDRQLLKSQWIERLQALGCTAPEPLSAEKLEACRVALSFYRAAVIGRATAEMSPKSMSPAALMNGILSFFGSSETTDSEAQARALALTEELIAKEPRLYAARKAKVALLMFQKKDLKAPETFAAFHRAIEECQAFGQSDNELNEANLVSYKMAGDADGFRREVNKLMEREPRNPLGYYFYASIPWGENNREGTIAALERARALDQNDTRIRDTLEKVRTAEAGAPNVFTAKMTATFEDL